MTQGQIERFLEAFRPKCGGCGQYLSHQVERSESARQTFITYRHPEASVPQPDVLNLGPRIVPAPIKVGRFQIYGALGDSDLNYSEMPIAPDNAYALVRRLVERLLGRVTQQCHAVQAEHRTRPLCEASSPGTSLAGPQPRRVLA